MCIVVARVKMMHLDYEFEDEAAWIQGLQTPKPLPLQRECDSHGAHLWGVDVGAKIVMQPFPEGLRFLLSAGTFPVFLSLVLSITWWEVRSSVPEHDTLGECDIVCTGSNSSDKDKRGTKESLFLKIWNKEVTGNRLLNDTFGSLYFKIR